MDPGTPMDPEDHPSNNMPTATEHHAGTIIGPGDYTNQIMRQPDSSYTDQMMDSRQLTRPSSPAPKGKQKMYFK